MGNDSNLLARDLAIFRPWSLSFKGSKGTRMAKRRGCLLRLSAPPEAFIDGATLSYVSPSSNSLPLPDILPPSACLQRDCVKRAAPSLVSLPLWFVLQVSTQRAIASTSAHTNLLLNHLIKARCACRPPSPRACMSISTAASPAACCRTIADALCTLRTAFFHFFAPSD